MEKDLDGWELISDDGFLDFEEDGERKIFVGKQNSGSVTIYGVAVDVDYFVCRSPDCRKIADSPWVPNRLVPVPIRLESRFGKPQDDNLMREITFPPLAFAQKMKISQIGDVEADPDRVTQVFFKKKENELGDMKMDRVVFPQIDTAMLKFEDSGEGMEKSSSPRVKIENDVLKDCDEVEESNWEENNYQGFNLFKWGFTGIGAICSFGVAAAAVCILFFGSQKGNTPHCNHKIRFHVYTDDKKIKQMVQQATRLDGSISEKRVQIAYDVL